MIDQKRPSRPKFRMFAIAAMCLGLMAIGASSASAATTPKRFNFTATAHNVLIGTGVTGPTRCEALTLAGQLTQVGTTNEKAGTATSISGLNCVSYFIKFPTKVSLNTPWPVKTPQPGTLATFGNPNLHFETYTTDQSGVAHDVCTFDMSATGTAKDPFTSAFPWTVKNTSYSTCSSEEVARPGAGYLEANFNGWVLTPVS